MARYRRVLLCTLVFVLVAGVTGSAFAVSGVTADPYPGNGWPVIRIPAAGHVAYQVPAEKGDTISAASNGYFDIGLYSKDATSLGGDEGLVGLADAQDYGTLRYLAPADGTYYLYVPGEIDATGTIGVFTTRSAFVDYTAGGVATDTTPRLISVTDTGAIPIVGRPVQVRQSVDGGTTWRYNSTVLTDEHGGIGKLQLRAGKYVVVPVVRKTMFRVTFGYQPVAPIQLGSAVSEPFAVVPWVRALSNPKVPKSVTRGRAFSAWGVLDPWHKAGTYGATIEAQRQLPDGAWGGTYHWTALASDFEPYGFSRYGASVRLAYAGKWRIRARHIDGDHRPTTSGWSYLTAK